MKHSSSRTYASVDLSAVRHNFHTIKALLRPGCKVLSVVKADGYGHGGVEIAKALPESDYFGVACINEAIELRNNGIETPILILGFTSPDDICLLPEYRLTQCAFDEEYLQLLQNSLKPGQKLSVHLKIDTGMSRLGWNAHDEKSATETANSIARIIPKTPSIHYEGIFTHFTSSEDPSLPYTKEQFSCFMQVVDALKKQGITFPLRHCSNSGGVLRFPELQLDMVRPGIALYGYAPDPAISGFDLHPALEWKTVVAQIHTIAPGDSVSYNRTFQTDCPRKVATVCVGYADGLSRTLSNGGTVLINGHKTQILGRVCMDQCIIDVTGIPVKQGDTVTLIGTSGTQKNTAEDMAKQSGTICYEILCNISKRVPRIYTQE